MNGSFAGMVFVAGTAPLSDYWIDRTEVTNRDYKQFVDRGRYDERRRDRILRWSMDLGRTIDYLESRNSAPGQC